MSPVSNHGKYIGHISKVYVDDIDNDDCDDDDNGANFIV